MADLSNTTANSRDNRAPIIRLMNDISALARMASITYGLIDNGLRLTRAEHDAASDTYTFHFSGEWLDQIEFVTADVMDRARSISERLSLIDVHGRSPS